METNQSTYPTNDTIPTDSIQSTTIPEVLEEIAAKYGEYIDNLAARLNIGDGDLVEAIATHIVITDTDWTLSLIIWTHFIACVAAIR